MLLSDLGIMDNRSSTLRALGSGFEGFGFLNFSFDWSSISSVVRQLVLSYRCDPRYLTASFVSCVLWFVHVNDT